MRVRTRKRNSSHGRAVRTQPLTELRRRQDDFYFREGSPPCDPTTPIREPLRRNADTHAQQLVRLRSRHG